MRILAIGRKERQCPSDRRSGDCPMRKISLAKASRSLAQLAAGRTLDLEEMRTRVRRMGPPTGNGTPPALRRSRRG